MTDAELGARANAHWCDAVCGGVFDGALWTSPRRTRELYPDAVTLAPGVTADEILSRVDWSEGCSVKDSFFDVDLSVHGFRVLFEARWLRAQPAGDASGWRRIDDAGSPGVIVRCGDTTAILNTAEGVIGIGNIVGDLDAAFSGAAAFAQQLFGPLPVIGYETEPVASAKVVGELRVWMKGR